MRKVFISYARQNKPDVEQLVEHLRVLGCDTWHDSSLRGGQDWWDEILRRIADCDTFIAIISRDALSSTACRREFDWAESLNKAVMPVALETPPKALPRRFSRRQIVDYSDRHSRDRAALTLAGGLATLSAAPPLPDPLPEPPAAPLSYLTDLIDLVTEEKALDHDQQRHILNQLEPALRSVDPEERRGGRDILEMLSSRDELYADVDRTIAMLKNIAEAPSLSGTDDEDRAPQTSADAFGPEPFSSTQATPSGDVPSPKKTTQPLGPPPEHSQIDQRPAAHQSPVDATEIAEPTTAATPTADRLITRTAGLPASSSASDGEPITTSPRTDQNQTDQPIRVPESTPASERRLEGRPDASVSTTGLTTPKQTLYQRLRGRPKILAASSVAAAVVVAVAIGLGSLLSSGGRTTSPTSTNSPPTSSALTPSSTADPRDAARLMAMVPNDIHCQPASNIRLALATVSCQADQLSISYSLFRDQTTMHDDLETSGFGAGQGCPGAQMGLTRRGWSRPGDPQQSGEMICYWKSADDVHGLSWTIDSQLLVGTARAAPKERIEQVYQWWTAHYQ